MWIEEGSQPEGLAEGEHRDRWKSLDPVPARHLGDGEALHDLQHCLVALLHDSQFDQHVPALPRVADPSGRLFEVGLAPVSGSDV
jgi:hypothetical protein